MGDSCEGCEMPYEFGNRLTKGEHALSRVIQGYWLSFASERTPAGRIAWPPYSTQDEPALVLGDDLHVEHHPLDEKCEFWDRFFPNDWHSVLNHTAEARFAAEAQRTDKLMDTLLDVNSWDITRVTLVFFFSLMSAFLCFSIAASLFRCKVVASTVEPLLNNIGTHAGQPGAIGTWEE